jgi:hypothetical protein
MTAFDILSRHFDGGITRTFRLHASRFFPPDLKPPAINDIERHFILPHRKYFG